MDVTVSVACMFEASLRMCKHALAYITCVAVMPKTRVYVCVILQLVVSIDPGFLMNPQKTQLSPESLQELEFSVFPRLFGSSKCK